MTTKEIEKHFKKLAGFRVSVMKNNDGKTALIWPTTTYANWRQKLNRLARVSGGAIAASVIRVTIPTI